MANNEKAKPEAEFRHNTSFGPNGEILFDCPIEIRNQQDLDAYGIAWSDCRTLNFHGSEKVTVFFYKTENRALAEYMWSSLDTQHSRGYANTRCWIPGRRKAFVRCRDTVPCATCPHKDNKQPPFISWDELVANGYEPITCASPENDAMAKSEYESIKAMMDFEDIRIARVLEMKELCGYTVAEIAAELNISQPRVYQLLRRAREIGRKYRAQNG